jgi:hypothetical protein
VLDGVQETATSANVQHRMQVSMTRVGLIIPREANFTEWERAGLQLNGLTSAFSWCLGDWLVFGKKHYEDRYLMAIRTAGLQYQTLRNYAWVARRFNIDRRRSKLAFQHHAEVASLPPDDQDRWLNLAEHYSWTSKKLRLQLRQERQQDATEDKKAEIPRRFSLPDHRVLLWQRAADEAGEDFEHWIINNLDQAATIVLGDQHEVCGSDENPVSDDQQ